MQSGMCYVAFDRRWDQIDVRTHFFDKCMKDTSWKTEADGMWYIEDYADFMGMLQKLELDAQSVETESLQYMTSTSCQMRVQTEKCPNVWLSTIVHVIDSAYCPGSSTAEMQGRVGTGGRTGCWSTSVRISRQRVLVTSRTLCTWINCRHR